MLTPLLINLAIAALAVCLSITTREEIVKVVAASLAILCFFLSLYFAPLWIKLLVVAIPLGLEKLKLIKFAR